MLLLLVFKQTNITNTILFVISLDRQKKKERVLISNRRKQPALEKSAGEFLAKKYLTGRLFLAESLRYELCSDKCRKAQALQNIAKKHPNFNWDAFLWCW